MLTDMNIAGLHSGRRGPQFELSGNPRHYFDQLLWSYASFGTQLLRRGFWRQLRHG